MPPKRRVVDASSCANSSKIRDWLRGSMPMPVSTTSSRTRKAPLAIPTVDPDANPPVCINTEPGQLSPKLGEAYVTILPQVPTVLDRLILEEHVIVGNSVSLIVTVNEHVVVLPAASVTRNTFVVVPTGKFDPDDNPAVCTSTEPGQLSPKVGEV